MYFSRTFKALNFEFQIQGLSRTFKVRANLFIINSVGRKRTHTLFEKSRGHSFRCGGLSLKCSEILAA